MLLFATVTILQLVPTPLIGAVGNGTAVSPLLPLDRNARPLHLRFPAIVALAANDVGNPNPGIHPINSKPYGLSYSEWSARWWQWVLQIPAATNPNLDATGVDCAEGQSGQVC